MKMSLLCIKGKNGDQSSIRSVCPISRTRARTTRIESRFPGRGKWIHTERRDGSQKFELSAFLFAPWCPACVTLERVFYREHTHNSTHLERASIGTDGLGWMGDGWVE